MKLWTRTPSILAPRPPRGLIRLGHRPGRLWRENPAAGGGRGPGELGAVPRFATGLVFLTQLACGSGQADSEQGGRRGLEGTRGGDQVP